jgi:hypothetical protein
MGLWPTDGDENRGECGSVDEARDMWRPFRSLIRDPRCEPINVTYPSGEGRSTSGCVIPFVARPAASAPERKQ